MLTAKDEMRVLLEGELIVALRFASKSGSRCALGCSSVEHQQHGVIKESLMQYRQKMHQYNRLGPN